MASNGLEQIYPTRAKASRKVSASLIRPLFDLEQLQPFLLRPLEPLERSLVKQWCAFCRRKLDHHRGPVSDLGRDFLKEMASRGYTGGLINGHGPNLLFQNLFIHAPKINVVAAVMRISGNNIRLSEQERNLAFREIVEMHREKYGEDNFPTWNDIDDYFTRRVFLPETGVLVPSSYVFRQFANSQGKDKSVEAQVRRTFKIPDEISEETLKLAFANKPLTDQDFAQNYKRVYEWMHEINPTLPKEVVPSRVDIDAFYKSGADGALSASQYDIWQKSRQQNTPGQQGIYDWLRDQLGLENKPRRAIRKNAISKKYWTPARLKQAYIALWKFDNPNGFDPASRILIDPPTRTRLEGVAKIQTAIMNQYGKLIPSKCDELGVPAVAVPPVESITNKYPGGFPKMLRDIEDEYGRGHHIRFNNNVQLAKMHHWYRKNNITSDQVPFEVSHYRVQRTTKSRFTQEVNVR